MKSYLVSNFGGLENFFVGLSFFLNIHLHLETLISIYHNGYYVDGFLYISVNQAVRGCRNMRFVK